MNKTFLFLLMNKWINEWQKWKRKMKNEKTKQMNKWINE